MMVNNRINVIRVAKTIKKSQYVLFEEYMVALFFGSFDIVTIIIIPPIKVLKCCAIFKIGISLSKRKTEFLSAEILLTK